ncbi:hypothetical protein Pan161_25700 [Gimesia algae]|uniref:Uncharacterized protein n=1 Tax=Gimesia algae TaxID=2527971 RepID=A0A517VD29_9PLAN|nr:hypothetical protein Pan161_25700 [Gimesia algae]
MTPMFQEVFQILTGQSSPVHAETGRTNKNGYRNQNESVSCNRHNNYQY